MTGHKATGLDGLTSYCLKEDRVSKIVVSKLTETFNKWFANGRTPQYLKTARVIPLSKEDNEYPDFGNIRTISILPIVAKVYEKVLLKRLLSRIKET